MSRRLERDRSLLLVVDVQQRLAPHVADAPALVERCHALLDAAGWWSVPAALTEHCPEAIGEAIAPLRARFATEAIFVKRHFAATDEPGFVDAVRERGRTQVVVAGMEAHVCVLQTVLGLLDAGFEVFVVGDAVGSRAPRAADRAAALERMRSQGCTITGTETVLFEWARDAQDARFRNLLAAVKRLP